MAKFSVSEDFLWMLDVGCNYHVFFKIGCQLTVPIMLDCDLQAERWTSSEAIWTSFFSLECIENIKFPWNSWKLKTSGPALCASRSNSQPYICSPSMCICLCHLHHFLFLPLSNFPLDLLGPLVVCPLYHFCLILPPCGSQYIKTPEHPMGHLGMICPTSLKT